MFLKKYQRKIERPWWNLINSSLQNSGRLLNIDNYSPYLSLKQSNHSLWHVRVNFKYWYERLWPSSHKLYCKSTYGPNAKFEAKMNAMMTISLPLTIVLFVSGVSCTETVGICQIIVENFFTQTRNWKFVEPYFWKVLSEQNDRKDETEIRLLRFFNR